MELGSGLRRDHSVVRWVKHPDYDKRAAKNLRREDVAKAEVRLQLLSGNPPPATLRLKPMEGHNGLLWEMRAGGPNRFILRRQKDDVGDYLVVVNVGPHDIYRQYNKAR